MDMRWLFYCCMFGCMVVLLIADELENPAGFLSPRRKKPKPHKHTHHTTKPTHHKTKPTHRPDKHSHSHTRKRHHTKPTHAPPCRLVNCVVGSWSLWGRCSVPCGTKGIQERTRQVIVPERCGGMCPYELLQTRRCNHYCQNGGTLLERSCHCLSLYGGDCCEKVHGQWSCWEDWGHCTATCGQGTQQRKRTCTSPPPLNGGRACHGINLETRRCVVIPCPVDGSWSAWKSWSQCSTSCDSGTQTRSRSCTNPPVAHGGKDCAGIASEKRLCNLKACPGYGGWSSWAIWSSCSVTCGPGTKLRTRTCTNPLPSNAGSGCIGMSVDMIQCSLSSCPGWSSWGSWSQCDKNCIRKRRRICSIPPSANGDNTCTGPGTQTEKCSFDLCSGNNGGTGSKNKRDISRSDVTGKWTNWTSWSPCSVTCGQGMRFRTRKRRRNRNKSNGSYAEFEPCTTTPCAP